MKYYSLNAVVNNEYVEFNKNFATRDEAIAYMFDFLNDNYVYDNEVEEEFSLNGNKHNIEYVLNNNNRFNVERHCY
jgi:hypothetical protein